MSNDEQYKFDELLKEFGTIFRKVINSKLDYKRKKQ